MRSSCGAGLLVFTTRLVAWTCCLDEAGSIPFQIHSGLRRLLSSGGRIGANPADREDGAAAEFFRKAEHGRAFL
jgi:hypothetical protein